MPWAILVGTAIRLLYAFVAQVEPWSDFESYLSAAHRINDGLSLQLRQSPGYPIFLSIFLRLYDGLVTIWLLNAVLGAMGVGLTYLITHELWQDQGISAISAWIVALYPDLIVYAGIPASENLVIPLVLGIVLILVRGGSRDDKARWVSAGLLLGCAFLVRGMLLGVLALFLIWIWQDVHERRWRVSLMPCALLVLSTVLVVSPWTLRNWRAYHAFIPVTTQLGLGLWGGNNPEADGEWAEEYLRRQEVPTSFNPSVHGLTTRTVEVDQDWFRTRQALKFIGENPKAVLALMVKKFGLFWGIKMDGVYRWSGALDLRLSLLVSTIGHAGMVSLFLAGLLMTYPWSVELRAVLVFTVYMLVLTVVFYFLTRYRLLLYPLWAPFAAYATSQMMSRTRWWEAFPVSPKVVALLGVFLVADWFWIVWRNLEKIGIAL